MNDHDGNPIGRRQFMTRVAVGATALSLPTRAAPNRPRRPNVIYAFADEHRYQSMSFTEMPALITPNMARLAEQGASFTNCISNYPVCSPHRAILMTGRWPYQQGMIDNDIQLRPDEMTLGRVFKSAGYHTAYIGKWHLGGLRAEPFGFDHSLIWTGTNTHWDTSEYHPADAKPVRPKGYNATLMTDQAIEFIDAHVKDDAPFFLMLSWNPPHASFLDPPEGKKALYPEGSLAQRTNAEVEGESDEKPAIWKQNTWPYYQGYHAHVSAIDDELGRIMAKLDELGIAEDTILVYSADHGSMLGSHGVGGKRQPHEESIRVPFIIRWPGLVPAGLRPAALFGTIDVMPSLCALAGVPVPDTCLGLDFSPTLRGQPGPDPDTQFIMHISKRNASGGQNHPAPIFRGVRSKRYTYAVYPDRPWCLFDNEQDPFQSNNRIDDPALADTRNALDTALRAWVDRAEDPFSTPA
ncbi:MAG TPA: sulfatase [Candidatus Hydrogenedentes bacterium]|nr:sulfatase [Candidatus Hydrogenedentota bacterium]HPG66599.1 sulfatase [Candidatus Hydrogenedentota bacterium]